MSPLTTRIAAAAAATGLTGVALYQTALALGAPLGRAAWGGAYLQLPTGLRIASAASAAFLCLAALLVLGRGGYRTSARRVGLYRWGTWGLVALLGLSAVGNLASPSRWENLVMGPIAFILSLLCALVALSPTRNATR